MLFIYTAETTYEFILYAIVKSEVYHYTRTTSKVLYIVGIFSRLTSSVVESLSEFLLYNSLYLRSSSVLESFFNILYIRVDLWNLPLY